LGSRTAEDDELIEPGGSDADAGNAVAHGLVDLVVSLDEEKWLGSSQYPGHAAEREAFATLNIYLDGTRQRKVQIIQGHTFYGQRTIA
jgi:hypothetical protein